MALEKAPCVFIIVLNWNGWQDTIECLHSLENLDYPNYEVIVVDNGSTNHSVRNIKKEFPGVKIIALSDNGGFAAGNNAGIRYAMENDADYCWILNNDTVVDQKALCLLVHKIENNSDIGICGSKVIYYHQPDTIQVLAGGSYNKWIGVPKNFGQHRPSEMDINAQKIEENLDFIIGASMLVSRSFLEDVGLLCEDYFLYYEEIDWGLRAKGEYKFGFAPESLVYHKEGASTGATNRNINEKSRLSDYYHIKNRLKITYKFFPWLLPLNYLTCIYSIFNRLRRKQWDRIPMILKLCFTFNNSEQYEN